MGPVGVSTVFLDNFGLHVSVTYRVLLLSRWWAGIVRVAGNTLSAPYGKGRDGLQGRLGLVCRQGSNRGREVRQKPLGCLAWVTSTEETDLVEEDV